MASNQLLTSSVILDRALAVLSEEPTFLDKINRQYDDSFGYRGGAKVGDTVRVRVPQRATVRTGRIMDIQPQVDKVVNVEISNYVGVDTGASSAELALDIDDYQRQFIDPKIPDLVARVEADVLNTVIPQIPWTVGSNGPFNDPKIALRAGAFLDNQLAPKNDRNLILNPLSQIDIVDSLKGLFNSQEKVDRQYRKGRMATDTLGFDWYTSTLMPNITRGTANASYTVNGANQTGSTLAVTGGTGTINRGDTFTLAGVFAVHPQTKQSLGYLQEFTVTANYAGGAGNLSITPAIVATGSEQNVSGSPANTAAITIEGTSGTVYAQNIAFARDAFYFVTADLPNPKGMGVDVAQRTWKGLTMRFINGYDQVNDMFISRFDIVYGAGVLRPELAVRIPATVS